MDSEDFAFALGEEVMIGTQRATVTGQATFSYEPDTFQLLTNDIDGLPVKCWYAEHLISKTIKH